MFQIILQNVHKNIIRVEKGFRNRNHSSKELI